MTPEVAVQGVLPDSKPPLRIASELVQPGPPPPTVSEYVVLCVADPVPVTVMVYVPLATDEPTATVMVEDEPDCTDDGLNDTVTPLGAPDDDSATFCAEPLVVAVLTVAVTELPAVVLPELGFTETEKSFVGVVVVTDVFQTVYATPSALLL